MIGFLPNCPAVADYLRYKLHLRSNELVTLFVFVLGIVNMFISFIDYDILGENNPFSYSSCFHWWKLSILALWLAEKLVFTEDDIDPHCPVPSYQRVMKILCLILQLTMIFSWKISLRLNNVGETLKSVLGSFLKIESWQFVTWPPLHKSASPSTLQYPVLAPVSLFFETSK